MHLLVCVLNQEEKLDQVLAGFLKLGVTGATVLRSEGMGRVLTDEVPILSGLQTLRSRTRPQNVTILSIIDSQETLDAAVATARELCGDFQAPGTGILFTVPVDRVEGLASELPPEEG